MQLSALLHRFKFNIGACVAQSFEVSFFSCGNSVAALSLASSLFFTSSFFSNF